MESAQDICGMTKGPRRHGGGMRRLMKQLGKKVYMRVCWCSAECGRENPDQCRGERPPPEPFAP